MKRWILSILLVAMLGLAACSPASTPAATEPPAATETEAATEAATEAVTEAAEPTRTPLPSVPAACAVTDIIPAADPQLLAVLPAVTENDYYKGPANAALTILEYSDYQ